jgi:NodT family efflux transporter outer membrane factor (OMF) lipoprotein
MNRLPFIAVAGLLSAPLAGCLVGPDYVAPDARAASSFGLHAEGDTQPAKATAELATWWAGFQDPLLSSIVSESLTDNLDLAQAVSRVQQSRALLSGASAALLPVGEISGQTVRNYQSLRSPLGRILDATSPDYDRSSAYNEVDVGASWELDLFGGHRRAREAAAAELQAAEAGFQAARITVAAQTADAYLVIRGLQNRLAIAHDQIDTQRRLVSLIKLQFDAGVAPELQLRQAEGALSLVEASAPALEAALETALNGLDIALGDSVGTHRERLSVASAIPKAPLIADAGGPAELLRRRPDLIVAERRLAASNAAIGAAISEYYPKFSLSGMVGSATTGNSGLLTSDANQGLAALGFRWRLFDFGRIDAQIAASRGRNAEALAAYKLAVLQASGDVENAFAALARREQQSEILVKGTTSSARARDAALAAYQSGTVSLVEVLTADAQLLSLRDTEVVARLESSRAAVAIFKALGGGWNPSDSTTGQPAIASR